MHVIRAYRPEDAQQVEACFVELQDFLHRLEPQGLEGKAAKKYLDFMFAYCAEPYGEAIATEFVESTVNQVVSKCFVKKREMKWSPRGAHVVLQIRTRVLNDELRQTFQRWYPGMQNEEGALKAAA